MESKGRLIEAKKLGKMRVTFELDYFSADALNEISGSDLRIKAEKWREKRLLNSNAYAWALLQKIAEKIHSDKMTVYVEMLQRYSGAFTHTLVKPEAVQMVMDMYRAAIDLGEIYFEGEWWHQLQVYYGSHTFNTKEMSVFLDGIVSECKELGIETLPDEQIERMVSAWDAKVKS